MPSCGCSLVVLHKEPKALIIVGTSCKLAPAKGGGAVVRRQWSVFSLLRLMADY